MKTEINLDNVPIGELALTDFEYLECIMEVCERSFGVGDLTVRARTKRVSEARRVAMYLARTIPDPAPSYPTIADVFGRDHTTVIHSYNRVGERIRESPRFAGVVERLIVEVRRAAQKKSES